MRRTNPKSGFTLAEVMLTIVIVGIALTMIVQSLSTAKMNALQTYNSKAARDLGMLTLGRVRAGLYREELDSRLSGNYAEEGYEDFYFDVRLGEEEFDETARSQDRDGPFHDSWQARQEREEREERDRRLDRDEEEQGEEIEEDYEQVRVKVTFPSVQEFTNHVILEEWIPWDQVYGSDEDEEGSEEDFR